MICCPSYILTRPFFVVSTSKQQVGTVGSRGKEWHHFGTVGNIVKGVFTHGAKQLFVIGRASTSLIGVYLDQLTSLRALIGLQGQVMEKRARCVANQGFTLQVGGFRAIKTCSTLCHGRCCDSALSNAEAGAGRGRRLLDLTCCCCVKRWMISMVFVPPIKARLSQFVTIDVCHGSFYSKKAARRGSTRAHWRARVQRFMPFVGIIWSWILTLSGRKTGQFRTQFDRVLEF